MISVLHDDGTSATYEADKYVMTEDGGIELLRFGKIGPYKCPLMTELVIKLPPGSWAGITEGS